MSAALRPQDAVAHEGVHPALRLLKRILHHRTFMVGITLVLGLLLLTLLGPFVAPHDPIAMDLDAKLRPPGAGHWFGTDNFGRDVLSRVLHGAPVSLLTALAAVGLSVVIGTLVGLISGFAGGWVDLVIQRLVEVMLAFPGLLLALVVVAVLGPGLNNVVLAVGIGGIPGYVRLVRGQVLAVKEREFVEAGRAMGAGDWRLMLRHILPNILSPIVVVVTLGTAGAIQATAALSFLGMGAQPPAPVWGTMVAEAQSYLFNGWWMSVFPGGIIALATLGLNLFGDGLRDLTDPRSAQK